LVEKSFFYLNLNRDEVINHITEEFYIQILVEKSSDTSGAGWVEHWGIPVFSKVK